MNLPHHFISCDWGTSNFRLRKVDSVSLDIFEVHQTKMGIKRCDEKFREQKQETRFQFFINYLMEELENQDWIQDENTIVVASGMISSSIGMLELEYAKTPLTFDGEDLLSQILPIDKRSQLLIISGARTDSDVMRGEETQAIGLGGFLPRHDKGILVFPGTHSKHLSFQSGRFIGFQTFMTGEIFELLVNNSIIQSAVRNANWQSFYQGSFLTGVEHGIEGSLMASLFSIRANNLIYKNSVEENYYYLSGLLIGSELSGLKKHNETIYLAASGIMHELYRLALESFLSLERIVCFDPGLVDKAVLIGQKKILNSYLSS